MTILSTWIISIFPIQCHGHLPVVNRQLPVLVARSLATRRLGRNDALVASVAEGAARYPGVQAGQGKGWQFSTALSGYFGSFISPGGESWWKTGKNRGNPSIQKYLSWFFAGFKEGVFELSCKTKYFFGINHWSHPLKTMESSLKSGSHTVNLDTFTKCLVAVAEAAPHLSGWMRSDSTHQIYMKSNLV